MRHPCAGNKNLHLHALLIIKHFTMQRMANVTQDAVLRRQMIAYVNSITDARLPRPLADHLRDGVARASAAADHMEALAKSATSPAEALALTDAFKNLREGLNPVYPGVSIRDLQKALKVDTGAAAAIKEFVDSGAAEYQTASTSAVAWAAITDSSRCEIPGKDGKHPDKLGHSAGKGGERRLQNNFTRPLLERLVKRMWISETDQVKLAGTSGTTAEQIKERVKASRREMDCLVRLISADPKNISLVPVVPRSRFPNTKEGQVKYDEAIKARLAIIVHVYFTHLHLARYCIIGTRKSHQACKARYPRLECDEALQGLMAARGALTELRNHGK
jgi:hypothetical protein